LDVNKSSNKRVYKRNPDIKGPMTAFGYSYLSDKLGAEKVAGLKLTQQQNLWGANDAYAYEALNLIDGKRSLHDIRNALSAEFGPVSLEVVMKYLEALEKIGVIERV
jgi:hypothetical protein